MGKLKKQTKASRARRLNMQAPLGGADAMVDGDETPFTLPITVGETEAVQRVPAGKTAPIGAKKVSSVTGETQGAMKTRQAAEWKKIREEVEKLKQQRRKIRKTEPDGARRRKELADRIKWLQVQYQERVQSERATLQTVEQPTPKQAIEIEKQKDETQALRDELEEMKQQMAQMQALLQQKMA